MGLRISRTTTEYLVNPLGIDVKRPRLSWVMEAIARGQSQSAYQILAASNDEQLNQDQGDLWDSGKVQSGESVHIEYQGKELQSRQTCHWKVRVWDRNDVPSDWSSDSYWSMGLLQQEDWQAQWIGLANERTGELLPSRYLRTEFMTGKQVRRATAYVSALGVYELYVNGERVGDHYFAPGWTDYAARVQYQTYDVTNLVVRGEQHAIGAILGTGWYCGHVGFLGINRYGETPYLLAQLEIEYMDGSAERVCTDTSWRVTTGPIQYSDIIMGETYDATLEPDGWNETGHDDSTWNTPLSLDRYHGLVTAQVDPPVRMTEQLIPVSVRKSIVGSYIFDMGQNMVGWVKLRVHSTKGQKVTVRYVEMLNPDGTVYTDNLRKARQENHYTLRGGSPEELEPHFTFHGFRYVEVIGLTEIPTLNTVIGRVVHSDTPLISSFETSDAMLNKLRSNIVWGQRGNFLSVPTDCPQRNERLGWTGDAQIFVRTACCHADTARFFTKYTLDLIDAQQPSGAFTDVAPDAGWIEHKMKDTRLAWYAPDNAAWGDAGVIIPWTIYQVYGDRRILINSYSAMVKWVEYLRENTNDLIRPDYSDYGDWLSIHADTPKDVLATAYFAYSTKLLAQTAEVLGYAEDAARYDQLFADIKAAFCKTYVTADGKINGDTQTVYVLALQFQLLDDAQREQAIAHLVADIEKQGNHLTTGFLGVGYLLPALTGAGRLDIAYRLLMQDTFPSWLYSVRHGATTIWERWDGWTEHNGFQDIGMNSFNHYSLGSVGEWMQRTITGIDTDQSRVGFKHIRIKPAPGGGLTFAKGEYESMYGIIRTEWKIEQGMFKLKVQVPVNTTASVYLPGVRASVLDGAAHAKQVKGEDDQAVYEVGSGTYQFESYLL